VLVGGEQDRLRSRGCRTLLFGTSMFSQFGSNCINYASFVLTPAVPYVYTSPSGAGCFCAASAIGSDMMSLGWFLASVKRRLVKR
jgi:hypothetical protein